jgi:CRISPR-associated protein Csm2
MADELRKKGLKGSAANPGANPAQGAVRPGNQGTSGSAGCATPAPPQTPSPARHLARMPEDYVAEAEQNMRRLGREDPRNQGKYRFDITTSKIRNILSMVSDIYNDELLSLSQELSAKSRAKMQALHVRILYEAGRERFVEDFILKTKLLDYLKQTEGNRNKFMDFAKYMEALVAYHLYLGGRDK